MIALTLSPANWMAIAAGFGALALFPFRWTPRIPQDPNVSKSHRPDTIRKVKITTKQLGIEMEVVPVGNRWQWSTWLTFDGKKSLIATLGDGWNHPSPYEVRGVCKNQGEAWARARKAANNARERYAQLNDVQARTHKESFEL